MKKLLLIFSVCLLANITLGQSDSVNYFISDYDNSDLFEEEFMKTDKEKYFYSEFLLNNAQYAKRKTTLPTIQLSQRDTYQCGYNHYHNPVSWITDRRQYIYNDQFDEVEQYIYSGSGSPESGQTYGPIQTGTIQKVWENDHRLQQVFEFVWNGDLQQCCIPYKKTRYYYTVQSEISQIDYYKWQQSLWVLTQRKYYSYDDENRLSGITLLLYDSANQNYLSSNKTNIVYDDMNNSCTETVMNWDTLYSEWKPSLKNIYFTDSLQRPLQTDKYVFNNENQVWDINYRYEYIHNANNTVADIISWYIHPNYGYFRKMQKLHLFYDNGNMTLASVFWWSDSLQDYTEGTYRSYYSYDNSYGEGEFIYPINSASFYNGSMDDNCYTHTHPISAISFCYWNEVEWFPYSAKSFQYTPITFTDISETNNNKASIIYPNPTMDGFTVLLPDTNENGFIEVFDFTGRMVMQTAFSNGQTITTEGIGKGMYLYRVSTNNVQFSGKLIFE